MMKSLHCKSLSGRLEAYVNALIPLFQEMSLLASDQREEPKFKDFVATLNEAAVLVKKCDKVSPFNLYTSYRYANQISKLEEKINNFLQYQVPANILLDVRKLLVDLKNGPHDQLLQSGGTTGIINSIFMQVSKLTNDPSENTMMLQRMAKDEQMDVDDMEMPYSRCNTPENSNFIVGLEKSMLNLKALLLQSDVSVVGVQCMGGGGKTTLALALCNHPEIKGYTTFTELHI